MYKYIKKNVQITTLVSYGLVKLHTALHTMLNMYASTYMIYFTLYKIQKHNKQQP